MLYCVWLQYPGYYPVTRQARDGSICVPSVAVPRFGALNHNLGRDGILIEYEP
jgi:hypothetical protein